MQKGFYIHKFQAKGTGNRPATLTFEPGANLVTGASDTGKSYVFTAINYVLGRSTTPDNIPESIGYNELFLEIKTFGDDKSYTLKRQLGQSKIEVKECELKYFDTSNNPKRVYNVKSSAGSQDTISYFLLALIGASGKRILTNKTTGKSRELSFKNLLQLFSVAEERIITKESPFYSSGQFTERLFEQSLLNFLLTGIDASEVQEKMDSKQREVQIKGKLELVSNQISRFAKNKEDLIVQKDNYNFYDLKEGIDELNENLLKNLIEAQQLQNEKESLIAAKTEVNKKILYYSELISKFLVLNQQYLSDKKRLEFISEAEFLSSQLGDVVCPLCSSSLDNNHYSHLYEIKNFREAINVELTKIDSKLLDLNELLDSNKNELIEQENHFNEINHQFEEIESRMKDNLSPKIEVLRGDINELLKVSKIDNQINFINSQITFLYEEKDRLENMLSTKDVKDDGASLISYSNLSDLSNFISNRLKNWNYESFISVDFDSNFKEFDIVISGKNRRSYGKGKRAVSYSACLLGILDYTIENNLNSNRIVILDSPLTSYEEKKGLTKVSEINKGILNSFFKDISKIPKDRQVIIFDNKIPESEIAQNINLVLFTGLKGVGRPGFFQP